MNKEISQVWVRINMGRFVACWMGTNTGVTVGENVEEFPDGEQALNRAKEIEGNLVANGYRYSGTNDGYHMYAK